jgi:hypothetical protein
MPLSRNLGTLTSCKPLGPSRPVTVLLYLLTSWNPLGHSRPVTGLLYLYLYYTLNVLVINVFQKMSSWVRDNAYIFRRHFKKNKLN